MDELSSDLIKCKIQIGTLEASNENLHARVAANHNAADTVASLRKQVAYTYSSHLDVVIDC